jgi:ribonuclease P protein component
MGARFRKRDRIVRTADFQRLHDSPLFAADHVLVIKASRNGLDRTRLGVSVSVRAGSAVRRNRWKRLIREQFRLNCDQLPAGWDLLVRPRRGAEARTAAIRKSLVELARRIDRYARRTANRAADGTAPPQDRKPGDRRAGRPGGDNE